MADEIRLSKMRTTATHPVSPPPVRSDEIPARWHWHYDTLLKLRSKIVRDHDERCAAIRATIERGGADLVDVAADERENRELLAELSIENAELHEIDSALERMRSGTYGRCEATGQPISAARLRALPWTRFSREAAAEREKPDPVKSRFKS
jgi:RNA polymerase-binding transcription factor DksA